MSDAHLHLVPHADASPIVPDFSRQRIEQYLEVAAGRGVGELCFTEHYYRCVEAAPYLGAFWEGTEPATAQITIDMVEADRSISLDDYVEAIVAARDFGLPVRLGLELDVFPDTLDAVLGHIEEYPFDFVIGSVHWLGGLIVDMEATVPIIEARGLRRTWEEYAHVVATVARSGLIDAVGHIDLLKKFGLRLPEEPIDLYREMVEGLVAGGVAVEVNTSGLSEVPGELYPAPTLLRMAREAGVPITFGSDAHRPEDAAAGLEVAWSAAREAGYDSYLRFEGRTPAAVPLPGTS
ncbi:MAG: histidinol-phosphatase HisJ family protein [Acidimicrobiia bacterium]|nr:histidinol-phosphatase HisJ family protein [Acidimicrobiia bacterium]